MFNQVCTLINFLEKISILYAYLEQSSIRDTRVHLFQQSLLFAALESYDTAWSESHHS